MDKNKNIGQKSKFWTKIEILEKIQILDQKSKFCAKIETFDKNPNFGKKIKILHKNSNFDQKPKILILTKKENYCQTSIFRSSL